MRQGKTLLTTIIAYYSDRNVYSNYTMKLDNVKPLTLNILYDVGYNVDIIIDEGYTWLESRVSSSDVNLFLSQILFQSGKRNVDFYITAQLFSTLDLRFRKEANIYVICKKMVDYFEYTFIDRLGNQSFFVLPFIQAQSFYNLYDTFEIVPPHNLEKMRLKFMSPKEKYKEAQKIFEEIYDDLKGRVTKDNVERIMKKHDYTTELLRDVYLECKDFQEGRLGSRKKKKLKRKRGLID